MYGHTSGYLSFQVKWTARCRAQLSAHWENFLYCSFRDVSEMHWGAAAVCLPIMQSFLYTRLQSPLPLSADHRELLIKPQVQVGKEKAVYKGEGFMGIWTTSCNLPLTCTFRACLGPTAYSPLPFDDEMLTCMPNFMAWWTRRHPTMLGGSSGSHGNLVAQC